MDITMRARAHDSMIIAACGDALGVPYEVSKGPLVFDEATLEMTGGGFGKLAPGVWSDDTEMSMCILLGADVADLSRREGIEAVASWFERWYDAGPADVGLQTRAAMRRAQQIKGSAAERLSEAALWYSGRHPDRAAGNGALMRTGIIGALLADRADDVVADTAVQIARLTHADPLVDESVVIWSVLVARAIRTGTLDLDQALSQLDPDRAAWWRVELEHPDFDEARRRSGFTVNALICAYVAVTRSEWSEDILRFAVAQCSDPDTVAAIAGSLAGALYGQTVPRRWVRDVHGWPKMDPEGMCALFDDIVSR